MQETRHLTENSKTKKEIPENQDKTFDLLKTSELKLVSDTFFNFSVGKQKPSAEPLKSFADGSPSPLNVFPVPHFNNQDHDPILFNLRQELNYFHLSKKGPDAAGKRQPGPILLSVLLLCFCIF